MKKNILILSFLCFSVAMMAQEAELVQTADSVLAPADTIRIKGVHPWDLEQNANGVAEEIAHWSIIPRLGFSAFDGDFVSEMKHNIAVPAAGLAVEYNFTPIWSFGVEYMYDMYTVTGDPNQVDPNTGKQLNADTLLNGHMHKAGAYLAMDLINLCFPRAKKKIISIFPYVGAGAAWYKRSAYYSDDKYWGFDSNGNKTLFNPTHDRYNTANYINADGDNAPDYDTKYKFLGYIQGGIEMDFNLNRTLALGLRANYSYFTRDYVDGRGYHQSDEDYASKNNDGIFDITMNLRFKLEAVSKSHPRNMTSFAEFDKMLAAMEPKLVAHDTVIYHRHDSIIVREAAATKQKTIQRIFNVYFDNDKADLRTDAQTTIFEATQVLEEDTTLYAVLVGYCDNTASKAHNFALGERRAKNVMAELVDEYAIPTDHVYYAGVGKIAARKNTKSFGPNRRVSIHIVDKETFELMKMELQNKFEERNTDEAVPVTIENTTVVRVPRLENPEEEVVENTEDTSKKQTVPLSESARKEKINQYKKRVHETVRVEKGMTLSQLARQYYDNSQCWVYLFIANREKMNAPTDLQEGMEIIVPELTREEMQLTTKDCLHLYSIAIHDKQ